MIRFKRLFELDEQQVLYLPRVFKERINFEISDHPATIETFCLSKAQIEHVLSIVGHQLQYYSAVQYEVLNTLYWIGNGGQYRGIAHMHGVGKSTICRVVNRVVDYILDCMLNDVVAWPVDCAYIVAQFSEIGGFPYVIGRIDGTMINIDAPIENEAHFVNRHGNHALNVMMVCGPNRYVYAINASWPGSVQ